MSAMNDLQGLPPIPPPQLQTVENTTPYPHLSFDKMGKGRLFYDVIVCKATFTLAAGTLQPAEKNLPIELADRYWDEESAETSSLKIAGDVVLTKPGTDVLLTGSARTHDGRARPIWLAGLRVSRNDQPIVEHLMRLLGPRAWQHGLVRGWNIGDSAPTNAIALRHELAYGGYHSVLRSKPGEDNRKVFAANPAGRGYWDPKLLDKSRAYHAPQIETLKVPVCDMGADYPLAVPAPLARFYSDRTRHGGTYDDIWQAQFNASAIPDFPADFDNRFFQCALPNLIAEKHLHGDERINLVGLVPGKEEVLICDLPDIHMQADMIMADGRGKQRPMALDTVQIDLDTRTVALVWRLTLDQRECIEHVRISQQKAS